MQSLLDLPADDLLARARLLRERRSGTRITYSPKVFIPLTMLCRDRCGYCTFAQPPARLEAPYLTPDQVLAIARDGARAGCHEALLELPHRRPDRGIDWTSSGRLDSTVVQSMQSQTRLSCLIWTHLGSGNVDSDALRLQPFSSVSVCVSQKRISISRYITAAVVRCT